MEEELREEIVRFVADSPAGRDDGTGMPFFDRPLVGYASAADPLFEEYRRIIGPFHRTPREVLSSALGGEARAESVACWVLPVPRPARESNRGERVFPSREWARTRFFGERLNVALRRHVTAWLEERGFRAQAPQLAANWQEFPDTPVGIASTWSERHAAYAAGLGTFSLNDGLITAAGIAHRLGSVVTDLPLRPTARTAPGHLHNCLFHREGSCGACIARCPVDALSRAGHDKARCREHVYGAAPAAVAERFGAAQTGCGLCQTGVPCEGAIPRGSGAVRT